MHFPWYVHEASWIEFWSPQAHDSPRAASNPLVLGLASRFKTKYSHPLHAHLSWITLCLVTTWMEFSPEVVYAYIYELHKGLSNAFWEIFLIYLFSCLHTRRKPESTPSEADQNNSASIWLSDGWKNPLECVPEMAKRRYVTAAECCKRDVATVPKSVTRTRPSPTHSGRLTLLAERLATP